MSFVHVPEDEAIFSVKASLGASLSLSPYLKIAGQCPRMNHGSIRSKFTRKLLDFVYLQTSFAPTIPYNSLAWGHTGFTMHRKRARRQELAGVCGAYLSGRTGCTRHRKR